jgi:hypothetical protein
MNQFSTHSHAHPMLHRPHPMHWLHEHSAVRNILLAAVLTLLALGLIQLFVASSHGLQLPAMYPYGPVY